MFNRNRLSAAIVTVLASAAGSTQVFAQDAQPVEEVIVTGIRASAEASMDIKRDSQGVVDAISAEDIGKFPDTNLAESLQRITGVSISRQNGEGSEVTVRGFGPENNMVTLNGRTMPTGTVYAGGSGADASSRSGGSRAFNFSNLASDNISSVEVYKTSQADIATGGIGATINLNTRRPLDDPGLNASVGVKAVNDTTNRYNDDVTPEISGFVSWTDDNEVFGVSASLSYQERHSASSGITVNNWNIGVWGQDDLYDSAPDTVFDEDTLPETGQLYARPNDFRFGFSDTKRERLNGQLTLQYRPTDTITATVDYLHANNDIEEERGEVGNWIQNGSNISNVVFDDSAIATPLSVSEDYGDGSVDVGYEQQYRAQANTLDSFGVNVEFLVNDTLTLVFDAHTSTMESLPEGPGGSGEVALGLGAPVVTGKTLDFSGEIPSYSYTTTLGEDPITTENVGSSILRVRGAGSVNDINQVKLDGRFDFDDSRFDFGVEARNMEMESYQTQQVDQELGNWGIANPGELVESGLLTEINVHDQYDDFDVSESPSVGFRGNAADMTQWLLDQGSYPNAVLAVSDVNANNDYLAEDILAGYVQFSLDSELANFPINFAAGVRYEHTDVDSRNVVNPLLYLSWNNNNDFSPGPTGEALPFGQKHSYDNMLPSLSFGIDFTDDIKGRAAYSKTIARAGFADLRSAPSTFGKTGSSFNGYMATAEDGNPALIPLESNNIDLSLEWYYGDSSYASVGLFEKRVSNFIGTGQEVQEYFDIRDQTSIDSPRVQAALDDLEDLGLPNDDTHLYAMIVLNEHPEALEATNEDGDLIFPNGVLESGNAAQLLLLGETTGWDVTPEDGDPVMQFLTSQKVNNKEAKLYGAEFAVQHFFGETGFGVQANYTIVRGQNIGFNNLGLPTENQFALTGLSDTANVVLMYENYGFQARLAYNWRDEFLAQTNQGDSRNPRYVEDYQQLDFNVSYDVSDEISVSVEGINITEEDNREYNRNQRMLRFADDLGARYQIGVRYTL